MNEAIGETLGADPSIKRAMAIVLLKEALPLLDALGEVVAAVHLQTAIDRLQGIADAAPTQGSC